MLGLHISTSIYSTKMWKERKGKVIGYKPFPPNTKIQLAIGMLFTMVNPILGNSE